MFSSCRGGSSSPRRGLLAGLATFVLLTALPSTSAAQPDSSSTRGAPYRTLRSARAALPDVLARMRSDEFRDLVAPRDVRIELPSADPQRSISGTYSVEQAYFILREFLNSRELLEVGAVDVGAKYVVRSEDGRVLCECPPPQQRGRRGHGVVHLLTQETHGTEPSRQRLYVGLRQVDGSWLVVELRELR